MNIFLKQLEMIGYGRAQGHLQLTGYTDLAKQIEKEKESLRAEIDHLKTLRKRDPHKTYMRGAQSA